MAWESHVDALIAAFICAVWRAKKGEVDRRGGAWGRDGFRYICRMAYQAQPSWRGAVNIMGRM